MMRSSLSRGTRGTRVAGLALSVALAATGCGFNGIGNLPLPLREGTGDGSYEISVDLPQIANLVPNAEVMVNDVTVGSVTKADVIDWHARLTVALNPGTVLPANATARVAQKSLLGAEYLELAPPTNESPQGRLEAGGVIPLARTGRYPETEEVLGALSVVLNGSGLQQVRTISTELNRVFDGRQTDIRELIGNLGTFVGTLDGQRQDIVTAIDGLDRLSGTLNRDNEVLATGIEGIPPALRVLNGDREDLVRTFDHVGKLGTTTVDLVDDVRDDLLANLRQVRPAVQGLADSRKDLTESLSLLLTFPFPSNTAFPAMFRGDYGNLYLVLDLSPAVLKKNFEVGFQSPMRQNLGLLSAPPLGPGQKIEPLLAPFLEAPSAPRDEVRKMVPEKGAGALGGLLGGGK